MKIIISPTKEMRAMSHKLDMTPILFETKKNDLYALLKSFSVEMIHENFNVSFALAKKVHNYYQVKQDTYPAITLYSGTVFKQLQLLTYKEEEFKYLQDHLRICSSYYGIVRPTDGISMYRLDMLTKLDINLYDYWQQEVNEHFNDDDIIVNLASNEFSKMLQHSNMITIDFIELKAKKITRNAMHIKQARGKFLNAMVKQKISNLDDLKNIIVDEYKYDDVLSSDTTYVFKRNFISKK